MPNIPAICDRCGCILASKVKIKEETIHCQDHVDGTCDCGGRLRILDGTYTHLGGPLNYCNAPEDMIQQFKEAKAKLHID